MHVLRDKEKCKEYVQTGHLWQEICKHVTEEPCRVDLKVEHESDNMKIFSIQLPAEGGKFSLHHCV
jgi:hypothetical protein